MSRPMDRNNIYHGRGVGGYGPPPSDYGRGGSFYQQQSDYGRGGSYYQKPSDYGRGGSYYQQQSEYVRGGSYYQQSSNYGRGGSNYQQSSGYIGGSFNISQSGYGGGGFFNNPMIQSYQSPMMNYNRPGEQSSNNVNYSIPHEHQITTKNFPLNMQCDMCHGYGSNENKSFCYFCDICKFNICPECYNKIIKSFTQILHPHQLYMTSVQNKTCDICHSNKNKLFIKCNEGDFNCCINCFRERSDVKIEPTCTAQ